MQEENEQPAESTIPEMVNNVREGKMDRRKLIKTLTLMGISATGAGAIAAVAARQITANFTSHPNGDNNGQQHLQQHEQHLAHQSTGNVQQFHHDYPQDAIFQHTLYPPPFVVP